MTDPTPVSPISRIATFPHKTSPAVATQTPLIDTSVPAINAQPVELDGIPMGLHEQALKRREIGQSKVSPGINKGIDAEHLSEGGKGEGQQGRERRAAIPATRSNDPSVIVDVPNEPTAEEVEAADSTGRKGLEVKT